MTMTNTDLVAHIREDLNQVRRAGHQGVALAEMDAYLVNLLQAIEKDPQGINDFAIQRMKGATDLFLARLKHAADSDLEMFRSVVTAGQSALRAAMAINGLAATAVLAFLGNALAHPTTPGFVAPFAVPLACFIFGVLATSVGYGSNYVSQWLYGKHREGAGHIFNVVSIALTCASYGGFGFAAWCLFKLFSKL